jgi:4-hydroxybenzoate polyprenyltransferase
MGKNEKNNGLGLATLVALIGITIGRSLNPKVQLPILFVAIIYLIISFSIALSKKKGKTPNYIYIGALGVTSLYSLYLISKVYLGWNKNIQELLILITFVPIIYIVGMSIFNKLVSGDKEQVKLAKKGLMFLGVIMLVILTIVIAYFMK